MMTSLVVPGLRAKELCGEKNIMPQAETGILTWGTEQWTNNVL